MGGLKVGSVKQKRRSSLTIEVIATYCLLLVQETKRRQLQDYTAIITVLASLITALAGVVA